ncbi:TPA_asm: dihydroorotase, partial [Listeria monocytogenes]|nr:dihydroorotase [Listeria monocytogenes]
MYVLKNGQVLNASGELENKDVLIQNGKVNLIADSIEVTSGEEFDATG